MSIMEGKKSFILYSDQREIFDELSNENAGKLIKHIYSYVNDENPISDDELIRISFISIKLQLKRDLKKWEEQHEQRRKAGQKSAEIRKRALTKSNERSISSTDNVNVNDNVNDILNTESHNEIFRKLWTSRQWLESNCMRFKCEYTDLQNHLNVFRLECIDKEELKVTEKDAKEHFINWIKRGNPVQVVKKENASLQSNNWW